MDNKTSVIPGVFFDNQGTTFAFPSKFVCCITEIVTSIEKLNVTEKTNEMLAIYFLKKVPI